ncbi:MAG: hypothetical protein M1305_04925 [Candidatus Marsarchaeota archaeon]|nr:hypothetical protein [Candidatus Marsarchaeota archaeon]
MSDTIRLDWDRYALITELACRYHESNHQLGKTHLQKMVYLLQEIWNVDCGYSFEIYTYGPFDAQLLTDLDFCEAIGAVQIQFRRNPYASYDITPGPEETATRRRGADFLSVSGPALDGAIEDFGRLSAKELELRATIVFVDREAKSGGIANRRSELVDTVRRLKPCFTVDHIDAALKDLEAKGHIVSVNA